MKVSQS